MNERLDKDINKDSIDMFLFHKKITVEYCNPFMHLFFFTQTHVSANLLTTLRGSIMFHKLITFCEILNRTCEIIQNILPTTVTLYRQVAVLFAASVAKHLTSVVPIGKLLSNGG